MHSIRIIGAGSIGNHLANAARTRGWHVTLTDIDPGALERAKAEIYPGRYGAWNDEIVLADARDAARVPADVVFVGTPPDTHVAVALEALAAKPRVLLIEKPLAGPDLAGCQDLFDAVRRSGTLGLVGYNHCLGGNTLLAERLIAEGRLGRLRTISSRTRENWQGILKAHPWLAGPGASYLGFAARGGGAACEHSHAINIWQHFAHATGHGRVCEVSATLDFVKEGGLDYDQSIFATLTTKSGLVGDVIQDVVTLPVEKSARLQGDDGFIEWHVNAVPGEDLVVSGAMDGGVQRRPLPKKRADDFIAEIDHVADLLAGRVSESPISLERGLDTLLVIHAAFTSHREGRRVRIDWSKGYVPAAVS